MKKYSFNSLPYVGFVKVLYWIVMKTFEIMITEQENTKEQPIRNVTEKVKQKQSSFVPIFVHYFSGYDCHLTFKLKLDIKILTKSVEKYVSVQLNCLRFLYSYRFFSSNLDELVKSIKTFPVMQKNGLVDILFEKKLAYPY